MALAGAGTFFSKVFSRFQPPRPSEKTVVAPEPAPAHPVTEAPEPVSPPVKPAVARTQSPLRPEEPVVEATTATESPAVPRRTTKYTGTTVPNAALKYAPTTSAPEAPQRVANEPYDPVREAALRALEADLVKLCTLIGGTLVRVKRPPAVTTGPRRRGSLTSTSLTDGAEEAPADAGTATTSTTLGPLEVGIELAQTIEQRARGMLLETSLTRGQHDRIDRILQSGLDLVCALRAARYAWQIAQLLPQEGPAGRVALPRLRRVVEKSIEISSQVNFAIEGHEEAASTVAEHYRAFLEVKTETTSHIFSMREDGSLTQTARRLVRAALFSLTVAADSLAKVAARFALPLGTSRTTVGQQDRYRHLDRGDDLLAPLPRR